MNVTIQLGYGSTFGLAYRNLPTLCNRLLPSLPQSGFMLPSMPPGLGRFVAPPLYSAVDQETFAA